MGEHGEQTIQSNLESYNNLDNFLKEFEKRKSNIFDRDDIKVKEKNQKPKQPEEEIKEIKVKEIFVNSKTLKAKNKKDQIFVKNIDFKVEDETLWSQEDEKSFTLETDEERLEKAIKEEKNSRRNPLVLLEVFIKKIQRLCDKLMRVRIALKILIKARKTWWS